MQFYCIGGGGGGSGGVQNQSVSGVTTICHLLRIELIRLLIVACGMLVHSSSMAVRSCWILAGTGTRCRIRRSRASQTCSMGDIPVSMLAMQELGCFQLPGIVYNPCNMGPCIIMLQHEVMVVDEWQQQWASGLVTVSLCIQNAIINAPVFVVHNICLPTP